MRLTFTSDEINLVINSLVAHKEEELAKLVREKMKKSYTTKQGHQNKVEGARKAREKVKRKNINKITIAIENLTKKNEIISISSVANEASLAYNTVKNYKVRIEFAEADRKKLENNN